MTSERLELIPLQYKGLLFKPEMIGDRLSLHIEDSITGELLASVSADIWPDETALNRMFKMIGAYFNYRKNSDKQ